MVRILAFITCVALGIGATVKPDIVVCAAGAEYSYPCHSDLIGVSGGAFLCY
jgi:hypothetical protein